MGEGREGWCKGGREGGVQDGGGEEDVKEERREVRGEKDAGWRMSGWGR